MADSVHRLKNTWNKSERFLCYIYFFRDPKLVLSILRPLSLSGVNVYVMSRTERKCRLNCTNNAGLHALQRDRHTSCRWWLCVERERTSIFHFLFFTSSPIWTILFCLSGRILHLPSISEHFPPSLISPLTCFRLIHRILSLVWRRPLRKPTNFCVRTGTEKRNPDRQCY